MHLLPFAVHKNWAKARSVHNAVLNNQRLQNTSGNWRVVIARAQSRREFLRLAGTFALSASLPLEYTQPELILYNWNIIIVNDRQPRAEAVAIAGNRFLAVGMNEKVFTALCIGFLLGFMRGR